MEKELQYVHQEVQYDGNLDTFAAHLTPKPNPQQCFQIRYFEIISTVNPI